MTLDIILIWQSSEFFVVYTDMVGKSKFVTEDKTKNFEK